MPSTRNELEVRVAAEDERRAALELALRPLAAVSRGPLLDSVAANRDHLFEPLDTLIVAVESGRVVAAGWGQPSPGKAVALWLPEWLGARRSDSAAIDAKIVRKINAVCDAAGVPMIQALFEIGDDPRIPTLQSAGYASIATLDYLGRSVSGPGPIDPLKKKPLRFVPYDRSQRERLKGLLSQTYLESFDCPGLEELRNLDDVITGYLATGHHDPKHWLFVQSDEEDVGVLLMTEHPEADQAELVYMGIAPAARGNGYGAMIVDHAIATADKMGVDHLMVAVDRANAPARRIYDQANFAAWARRYVYVRGLGGRSFST